MLKLHGRPRSNYYNVVKSILLERDIPFEEVIEAVPPTDEFLSISPMAKIPCLVTPDGPLTETSIIVDYLEQTYNNNSLGSPIPYVRAKQHELARAFELYVEWVARRGYSVLRGEGDISAAEKALIKIDLTQAIKAVPTFTSFSPWCMGEQFSWVDIHGYFMFVYAQHAARIHAEIDLLNEIPGAADWFARVEALPSVTKALADAAEYAHKMQSQ